MQIIEMPRGEGRLEGVSNLVSSILAAIQQGKAMGAERGMLNQFAQNPQADPASILQQVAMQRQAGPQGILQRLTEPFNPMAPYRGVTGLERSVMQNQLTRDPLDREYLRARIRYLTGQTEDRENKQARDEGLLRKYTTVLLSQNAPPAQKDIARKALHENSLLTPNVPEADFAAILTDLEERDKIAKTTRKDRTWPIPNDEAYMEDAYQTTANAIDQWALQKGYSPLSAKEAFDKWWDSQYTKEQDQAFQKFGQRPGYTPATQAPTTKMPTVSSGMPPTFGVLPGTGGTWAPARTATPGPAPTAEGTELQASQKLSELMPILPLEIAKKVNRAIEAGATYAEILASPEIAPYLGR